MSRAPQYEFNTAPLLAWREPVRPRRVFSALTASILIHLAAFGIYLIMPQSEYRFLRRVQFNSDLESKAVPLVAPRVLDLTQRDPNDGKPKQQLDIRSALPPAPTPRSFRPPAPVGPREAPDQGPQMIAEAPEIQVDLGVPQPPTGPLAAMPDPLNGPPRAILENIGPAIPREPSPNPAIPLPRVSVEESAKSAAKAGGGGLGAPGDAGEPASLQGMQLLSDPQGVDFKPYLTQILATVRRNWFAVIPAAAQTGRRGTTVVQFSINRRGYVPKLVIAQASGTSSYDRAAVAAVSASYPFNPLPTAYKGDEIRVQMMFAYNQQPGRE